MKKNTFIIAGLGNPGKKYEGTRHNMGYMAVDELLSLWDIKKQKKRFSSLCSVEKKHDHKIVILKPITFMNDSGRAIKKAMSFYHVPAENVIVVYDDIDLAVGALRIRTSGGAGTHNGMRSVVCHIGNGFPRVRIGIGKNKSDLVRYVLSQPSKEEKQILKQTIYDTSRAIDDMVKYGMQRAMQEYNTK